MTDKEEIRSEETPERDPLCVTIDEIMMTIDEIEEILQSFTGCKHHA